VAGLPLTPYVREKTGERGLSVRGKRELSRWKQGGTHSGAGRHPRGAGEPFPVAGRLYIEHGHITRVRVAFGHGKLLQAGGDPRRGSAHHRPAPE